MLRISQILGRPNSINNVFSKIRNKEINEIIARVFLKGIALKCIDHFSFLVHV